MQGLHQLGKRFQGVDDQLRGRGTRPFVGGVQLVAKGAARRVERHRHVRGLFPLQHFQQVLGESVQDGHIRPLRIDHGPAQEGVVHLEYQCVPVYEEKLVHSV